MNEDEAIPQWRRELRHHLRRVVEDAEADPLGALRAVRDQIQGDLAEIATPLINAEMRERDQGEYESRKSLCSWVNETLRSLGLAVRCPSTDRPGILVANARDRSDWKGRFRFETRSTDGQVVRSMTSSTLPEVDLVPDRARPEGLWSSRHDRSR